MKKSSNLTTRRQSSEKPSSLSEIQRLLREIDDRRLSPEISDEEREVLELSAVALRDAERVAIARLQKGIIKDMEEITAPLNALSKEIRSRVKKMNKVPKGLDITGKIIKEAIRIIAGVGKWV